MSNTTKRTKTLKRFGKHLQALRSTRHYSQVGLAKRIGKHRQCVQRVEAGRMNPYLVYLIELSKGLNMPLSTLVKF